VFCQQLSKVLPPDVKIMQVGEGSGLPERIAAVQPTAMVISCNLPDLDGTHLLRRVKERAPALPVVLTATDASPTDVLQAFHLGACDFLLKPATAKALVAMMARLATARGPSTESQPIDQKAAIRAPQPEPGEGRVFSNLHCPRSLRKTIESLQQRYQRLFSSAANISASLKSMLSSVALPRQVPAKLNLPLIHSGNKDFHAGAQLEVHFFGSFQVLLNHKLVPEWPGHKSKLLLAYMLYHHHRRIYRDILMDKFWPNSTPDSARNSLNVAIHAIRSTLQKSGPGHEYILFKDECYYFCEELGIELDTEKFLRFRQLAQQKELEKDSVAALKLYEAAAAAYQGDFLEEYPYESWTDLERENLAETYLVILDKISDFYALDGKPVTAISLCEQILQKDNCREDVYRRLMICYNRIGQREKAVRIFKRCVDVLKSNLDVEPTPITRELYQKIRKES